MKINIQQKLFSDKDKERISNELLNGIGAQPTPQPVVKKKRVYTEAQKEANRIRHKKWVDLNYQRHVETCRRWRNNNPEKVLVMRKKTYIKNFKQRNDYSRKWRQDHTDRVRECRKLQNDMLSDSIIKNRLSQEGIINPSQQLIAFTKVRLIQKRLDWGKLNKQMTTHYLNIINQLKQEVLCS